MLLGGIAEVKIFLNSIYSALVKFYKPVLRIEVLDEMKEDLIECLTSMVVRGRLSSLLLGFSRVLTKDDEENLKK